MHIATRGFPADCGRTSPSARAGPRRRASRLCRRPLPRRASRPGRPYPCAPTPDTMLLLLLSRPQGRHVDREPVLHVAPEHPLVRLVDLLDGDHLDDGRDDVLAAEV